MCWPVSKAERRYAGVTHIDVADLDESQAEAIRRTVDASPVSLSGLGYYPNPLAPDPDESRAACEHLRRVISGAKLLGLRNVNTFIGRDWGASVEDNWPRFLETWKPLIAFAEAQDIRIGIENCPMSFTADEWPGGKNLAISPAIWARMFEAIPSPCFGLNYDPSHMVWQHMDYLAPLREFRDKIFHVHAKDARIDRHRLNQVGVLAHPARISHAQNSGTGRDRLGTVPGRIGRHGLSGRGVR